MIILIKRCFLLGVLAILGIFTLICVGLVVFEPLRDSPWLALAIGLTVGYSLFLMCVAYSALDRPIWRIFAATGILLAFFSMLIVCTCLAFETALYFDSEAYNMPEWMITSLATATLVCVFPAVGALRIRGVAGIPQWFTIASLLLSFILLEVVVWRRSDDPDFVRYMVISCIVTGAATLGTFLLYKFFGLKLPDPLTTFDQKLFVRCPRCLREQELPMGESHCTSCQLRFTIQMEEPRCPACGYSLRGLTSPQCPECGRMISQAPSAAIPA